MVFGGLGSASGAERGGVERKDKRVVESDIGDW